MKKINVFNMLFLIVIMIGDIFYIEYSKLWVKGIASGLFVLLGLINFVYCLKTKQLNVKFPSLMLTGLIFGLAGDVLLNVHFITGAILFAVAHVFYFASYCCLQKFKWIDLLYAGIIIVPAVLLITLATIFNFDGVVMEIVCVCYAIIISLMVGKALSNFIALRNLKNFIILIGSILFFFSDLMLLFDVFANVSPVFDLLCLATYYPAQFLLAFSILDNQLEK